MNNSKKQTSQLEIVNFLKNYGFIFPNSDIYGGLANAWDFGPLGVLLKNNIKQLWWSEFVTKDPKVVGLDSAIFANPAVWKASGHLTNFNDPLIDCKKCHNRFRVDKLIEEKFPNIKVNENTSLSELEKIVKENKITCPSCGSFDWTPVRQFNLMFKTHQSVIENDVDAIYLRPETAQGIFVNFANVQRSMRLKLPFGIGQIGKSFRNEITPGNFIFRTREFEQMELEYFTFANESSKLFDELLNKIQNFLFNIVCLNKDNVKLKEHAKSDLSHYSSRTIDIEYNFPHGWSELWGIANRTDFDLKSHINHSNANLYYLDPTTNQKIIPHVVEPSVGVERLLYAVVLDKYEVEKIDNDETREVLHLPYSLAPYKLAILPLSNKLSNEAQGLYQQLLKHNINITYDVTGSIGKRYRRQDAIGTPYCITFDFDSLNDNKVTIRNRDTMKQERINITDIINFIKKENQDAY